MARISAVVPAAGLSTRMGGPNKLLLPYGELTVVGSVVRTLLGCGLKVIVVTGRDAEEIARAVTPARVVFNARFEEGLGTSIACGVRETREGDSIMIALADMPGLAERTVRLLIEIHERTGPASILIPVYESEPTRIGHPVLFGPAYREELTCLQGDIGARSILQKHPDMLIRVPIEGDLTDIDRPDDLLRISNP